jgi:hypothetical protein
MLSMLSPVRNIGFTPPIRNRNPEPITPAHRVHSQKTRHSARQFHHPARSVAVTIVPIRPNGGEDHSVIRNLPSLRISGHCRVIEFLPICHERTTTSGSTRRVQVWRWIYGTSSRQGDRGSQAASCFHRLVALASPHHYGSRVHLLTGSLSGMTSGIVGGRMPMRHPGYPERQCATG